MRASIKKWAFFIFLFSFFFSFSLFKLGCLCIKVGELRLDVSILLVAISIPILYYFFLLGRRRFSLFFFSCGIFYSTGMKRLGGEEIDKKALPMNQKRS